MVDCTVFTDEYNITAYYLPGTKGWSNTFACIPTALWVLPYPVLLNTGPGFGVGTNGFGFTISWATNRAVVVQACTNLAKPAWLALQSNTTSNGVSYFSDPAWATYPARFYRIRSP